MSHQQQDTTAVAVVSSEDPEREDDGEVAALSLIHDILSDFDPATRDRMIRWIVDKLEVS